MGKSDLPTTGDGKAGGQKPKRGQITAKSKTGTILWKQTTDIAKPKPAKAAKPAKPAKAAEAPKPKRHRWFSSN